jgi:hypothetical protein
MCFVLHELVDAIGGGFPGRVQDMAPLRLE